MYIIYLGKREIYSLTDKEIFMKLIITGGAGFIGSNFIYYELKQHPEDEFICLDKLTYAGNLSSL